MPFQGKTFLIRPMVFCFIVHVLQGISLRQQEKYNGRSLSVEFMKVNDVYSMYDLYTFLTPNIQISCECNCHDTSQPNDTNSQRDYCKSSSNGFLTEISYQSSAEEEPVCPRLFRMNCQTQFSGNLLIGRFHSFSLKHLTTFHQFRIKSKSSVGYKKDKEILINESTKRVLINPEFFVEFSDPFLTDRNFFLDRRFIFSENSGNLLSYDQINKPGEYDLDKLGWFQLREDSEKPLCIEDKQLKKYLHVQPINCNNSRSHFKWDFNCSHFSSNGVLHFPKDVVPVVDKYKDKIHNILTNMNEEKVTIQYNRDVQIYVKEVNNLSFIFNATTFTLKSGDQELHLAFSKGKGNFHIEVRFLDWIKQRSFSIHILDTLKPFYYVQKLSLKSCTEMWVCVYQEKEQLCQLAECHSQQEYIADKSSDPREKNNVVIIQPHQVHMTEKIMVILIIALLIIIFFMFYIQSKLIKNYNDKISYIFE